MKKVKALGIVLVYLFFLSSCQDKQNSSNTTTQTATNSANQTVDDNAVVAKILGKEITSKDLYKGIEGDIYEAEEKVYDIKMAQLQSLILQKFAENHPDRKNMSIDDFIENVVSKGRKPTDEEINKFIQERDIPKEHINDELKQRISAFLERELKKKAVEEWVADQKKKNPVEIFLARPKRPIFNVNVDGSPYHGDVNAKVTIVEFSDFQCPFCAKGAKIVSEIKKKYGDKVKVVFKNFPLNFHRDANGAAQAGLCAFDQGNEFFWKMHDLMFGDQQNLKAADLKDKAKKIGLNVEQFSKCLDEAKDKARVEKDFNQGLDVSVRSTPTFYVNGQQISGAVPLETFFDLIDTELNK